MKQLVKLSAILFFLIIAKTSSATLCDTAHVKVTIGASADTICSGTAVIFTATDSMGVLPVYWWYENNVLVGGNSPSYTDASLNNGDSIWVIAGNISNCLDTLLDTSNHISITVNPTPPIPVISLAGGACLGTDSIGIIFMPGASQINWYLNGGLTLDQYVVADTPQIVVTETPAEPFSIVVRGASLYVSAEIANAIWQLPVDTLNANAGAVIAGGNGQGNGANQFYNPYGIAFDRQGDLYVCDADNNRVQMFPPGSTSATSGTTVAGGNNSGNALNQFSTPAQIAIDSPGNIYVSDIFNDRIIKFPAGSTSATMGTIVAGGNGTGLAHNQIYYAEGVCLDAAGNIYAADGGNSRVLKFPPNSTQSTMGMVVAGGNGYGHNANQLSFPCGVYVDANGYLFVTDRDNGRIQMFPPGSDSTTHGITVAGTDTLGSGPWQLYYPISPVAFDTTGGYMFVDDRMNERVLRYDFRKYYVPVAAGSYRATYTSQLGCVSGLSDSVTVYAPPAVTFSWDSLIAQHYLTGNSNAAVWCAADFPAVIPIAGGSPGGGSYFGQYVSNDTLMLTGVSATGIDTIFYTLTDAHGCSATVSGYLSLTVCSGVEEVPGRANFEIYPNPANGQFTLSYQLPAPCAFLVLSEITGREVQRTQLSGHAGTQTIHTQALDPGVYIWQVKTGGAIYASGKIVLIR